MTPPRSTQRAAARDEERINPQPHCPVCGSFMKRDGVLWRCPKISYDWWYGGWEHD